MLDTKEIREAKEKVTETKENIHVASIEKDISGLNDIIDSLDKKIEESNDYYDTLIEQTEKYWDSLVEGLENYNTRWQELADIEEQAKMTLKLRNLGITTDEVLNMSESSFESFNGSYLGLLQEMYSGNDDMIGMLQKFGGISTDALKPLSGTIDTVADSIDKFAGSTSNANINTYGIAENVGSLNTNAAELNKNLSGVSDTLNSMLDGDKLENVPDQVNDVTTAIQSVSDALDDIPDVDISGSIEQFDALGNSVDKTTASIPGGTISKASKPTKLPSKNTPKTQSKPNGSDNLIDSIENLGKTTAKTLGEPDGDGATGKLGELGDTIADAESHVTGIIDGLDDLDCMTAECTITVNIETVGDVPAYADGTAIDGAIGSMNLNSNSTKHKGSAHVTGTANVTGNWSVQSNEKDSLVGEEGYEIVVRQGRFFTVGDNGPEMFPIKKGDIVFNHKQSEELLKNGHTSGKGKAYADGTVGGGKFLGTDGHILRPLQPGDDGWDLIQKFQPLLNKILNGEEYIMSNAMFEHQKQMEQMVRDITTVTTTINNRNLRPTVTFGDIHVTCPGVTEQQVAKHIPGLLHKELNETFGGFSNLADQWIRR